VSAIMKTNSLNVRILSDIDGVIADFVTSWLAFVYLTYDVAISPADIVEHDALGRLLYKKLLEQQPQLLIAQAINSYDAFKLSRPAALDFEHTEQLLTHARPFFELLPTFIELAQADGIHLQCCTNRHVVHREQTKRWLARWGLSVIAENTLHFCTLEEKVAFVYDTAKHTRSQVIYIEDHPRACELLNAQASRKNLSLYLPATTYNTHYALGNARALRFPLRTLALQLKRILASTQQGDLAVQEAML